MEHEVPWPIPDTLYDTLCNCLKIKRVIHCSLMALPLRVKEYISHDPEMIPSGFFHTLKPPGLTLS